MMCWLVVLLIVAIIMGLNRMLFCITGENLTASVRVELLKGMMYKQLCWFDSEKRAPGALTNIISEDVTSLNGMTTETIATIAEAVGGLVVGFLLTCILSWRTAIGILLISPMLLVGIYMQSRLEWGNKGGGKSKYNTTKVDPYEKASALLSDVIMNYKTVIGFGEKNACLIIKKYEGLLDEPQARRIKNIHIAGFWFGYAQCCRMVFLGLTFWIGSWIITTYDECIASVYISIIIMFSAAAGAAMSFANVPSI